MNISKNRFFAFSLALSLVFSLAFGLASCSDEVDYLSDDISRYLTVSPEIYRGAELQIKLRSVSDTDIAERIMLDVIDFKASDNLTLQTSGEVGVGDKVKMTYTITDKNGKKLAEQKEPIEHIIGEGFSLYGLYSLSGVESGLNGAKVGEDVVISAYMPYDYPNFELACEEVFVNVKIKSFIDYNVPDITDDFIKDTLKLEDKLASYDGEGLTQKYRSYIKSELDIAYQKNKTALIENAVWEKFYSGASVNKLPRGEVNKLYDSYYQEVIANYEQYSSVLELDAFAIWYLELDENADWKAYLRAEAERAVTEKLAFYYVIRNEGFIPSEKEFKELYEKSVSEHLDVYLNSVFCSPSHYTTEEEYNEAVAGYKAEMMAELGEQYFNDSVYVEYGMEKLFGCLTIKNSLENDN